MGSDIYNFLIWSHAIGKSVMNEQKYEKKTKLSGCNMRKNKVLAKLRKGECVIIPETGHFASHKLLEMIGLIGFDGVWIDMEHKDLELSQLGPLTLACRATDMESIVRIAAGNYTNIIRPLEAGATGLVIPHCKSAEQARQIVHDSRFSPLGCRGFDGVAADAKFRTVSIDDYRKWASEEVLIGVMIEDKEAIDNIDEIAAVEGIDVLYFGPGDLSQTYGCFLDFDNKLMTDAIDKIAIAAEKHNRFWGGPLMNVEHFHNTRAKGASFFTHDADLFILKRGFDNLKEEYKQLLGNDKKST